MDVVFRRPLPEDAATLLRWRRMPEVGRSMFSEVDDDLERQRRWLDACESRSDFRHFVVCTGDAPVGYLSYSNIDWANGHCVSGSYLGVLEVRARVAGLWTWYIHDYCFFAMGMHKLINYVLAGNRNILKGQEILGFRPVGILREHVVKDGGRLDVHVFELLRAEWERRARRPFTREQTLAAFRD